MKVSNESFVEDKPCRGPGSFLGTIALPVHQVLEATALTTTVQEAIDSVRLASINDMVGWEGVTTGFSLETWNEGWSHLIVAGSLRHTAVGLMTLRSHEPRCQFPGVPPEWNVLSGEPHALADLVSRSRDAFMVGQLFHSSRSSHKVGACDPPGALTPPYESLDLPCSPAPSPGWGTGEVGNPGSTRRVTSWRRRRCGC